MSTASLDEVTSFVGHKDSVTSLRTYESGDLRLLFSSSHDRRVLCWSLADSEAFGRIEKEFSRHGHIINDVAVARSESFMVTVGADKLGRIIDTRSGKRIVLKKHLSSVTCAAINSQENKIVTGSVDRCINLWNTEGLLLEEFKAEADDAHKGWVTCLEFKPFDENELVSGSSDGTVKVWDVDARMVKCTFFDGVPVLPEDSEACERMSDARDGSFAVNALTLSADGNFCAYGGKNEVVYVLNLAENDSIAVFGDAEAPINSLAFGLTEVILACGAGDKIYIWDVMDKSLLTVADISAQGKNVKCLSLVWSVNRLFAGMSNGKILVFEFVRK